jgi:hypothetical protein
VHASAGHTGIQLQSYNSDDSRFLRGINFGSSSLRASGTGIRFASVTADRGVSFESATFDEAIAIAGGSYANAILFSTGTYTGSAISMSGITAANGINFASSSSFSSAAILLSGQNIATDTTTGMKIGTGTSQKIGFFNATPIVRPSGVAVTAAGIHAALVSLGLIAA